MRESLQEANAVIQIQNLIAVYNVPSAQQVHLYYKSYLLNHDEVTPGSESLETKLFSYNDIPWSKLAFPSVKIALEFFINNDNDKKIDVKTISSSLNDVKSMKENYNLDVDIQK